MCFRNSLLLVAFFLTIVLGPAFLLQSDPLSESMERGKIVYATYCVSCHFQEGQGLPGVFPPLAKSDYLIEDLDRSIKQIVFGVSGEMTVNRAVYNGMMQGFSISDEEVADVLNYIRNSWGNSAEIVTPEQVATVKAGK